MEKSLPPQNLLKTFKTFLVLNVSRLTFAPHFESPKWYYTISMKDKILRKSAEMFLSQGFKSVTMDEIAESLGISKRTIYEYYATKIQLVEATSLHVFSIMSNGIDEIYESEEDPIMAMYKIKKFTLSTLQGRSSSPIFQLQKYYPDIFQKIKRMQYDKMRSCMGLNLQTGIEKGLYRGDIQPAFISRIYFLGMNGIKDESIFPPHEFPPIKLHEEFLNYHLRGIVTPKGLNKLDEIIQSQNK